MSEHLTQAQLAERLAAVAKQVTVGGRYRHYKQQAYKVVALAFREEDNAPCVVYEAEYGNHIIFIRTLPNWLEMVEVNGQQVRRFTLIQDE